MTMQARPGAWWRALQVVSVACLVAALGIGGWLAWFYLHSATGGKQLLAQARSRIRAGEHRVHPVDCTPATGAVAELVIPGAHLIAPVVQGDGGAQLADAVGHVPGSAWPGGDGTAVLVGHDVTWFHGLGHLPAGSTIQYVSGCRSLTYVVRSSRVVTKGTSVTDTRGTLDLVTCWPLDALWFTGQRLLVQATEAGGATRARPVTVTETPVVPPVAVPADLVGDDTLAANPAPLGTLRVTGNPSVTFTASPGPLDDVAAAQAVYFAGLRAAGVADAADWKVVAPTVPMSAAQPLLGRSVAVYDEPLASVLRVSGDHMNGAEMTAEISLTTGAVFQVRVTEALVDGRLAVSSWRLTPA